MGITIHYDLNIIGDNHPEAETMALWMMAKRFEDEGVFNKVWDIEHYSPSKMKELEGSDPDNILWTVQTSVWYKDSEGRDCIKSVTPKEAYFFIIDLGIGCETATIGFVNIPEFIDVNGKQYPTQKEEWSLHNFCKTQFARQYGKFHYLKCHIGLCDFLRQASHRKSLTVRVNDEGDFYDTYDENNSSTLEPAINKALESVYENGLMISSLSKMFSDIGYETTDVKSPINEGDGFESIRNDTLTANESIVSIFKDQLIVERNSFFNMDINDFDDASLWFTIFAPQIKGKDNAEDIFSIWESISKNPENDDEVELRKVLQQKFVECVKKYE